MTRATYPILYNREMTIITCESFDPLSGYSFQHWRNIFSHTIYEYFDSGRPHPQLYPLPPCQYRYHYPALRSAVVRRGVRNCSTLVLSKIMTPSLAMFFFSSFVSETLDQDSGHEPPECQMQNIILGGTTRSNY